MSTMMIMIAPVGILFLIGLTWMLGGMKEATFAAPEEALDRFRQDFFGFQASSIAISDNGGHAALLQSADQKQIGLCFSMGDNFATRLLRAGDVADLTQSGNGVSFRLHEFTGRKVALSFDDEAEAAAWAGRLQPLA